MKQKRGLTVFLLIGLMVMGCARMSGAAIIPKKAKIHNQLGNDYCDKGKFKKGVEEYEKALKLYPNYTDALYNASLTYYMDLKNYGKAIYYFKRFLKAESDTPDAKQIKKWLNDAQKKMAAGKKATSNNRQVALKKSAQEKVKKEPTPKVISQAQKPSISTQKAIPSKPRPAAPQKTAKARPVSREGSPVVTRSPSPLKAAPGARPTYVPPQKQAAVASPKERARVYKERGNQYNSQGKPKQAVIEYLKALRIYPQYTDVLYNIAKTYDFSLKDYDRAIRYYKQFLKYESPSSPDAAQVKIWLAMVEQNKKSRKAAKISPPSKTGVQVAATAAKGENFTSGNKEGDFFIKELLSTSPVKAGEKKKEAAKKKASVKAKKATAVAQPHTPQKKVAVVPLVGKSVSPAAPVNNNREIVIETIIPKKLRASHIASMVMSRMQEEITEVFIEHKVKSPAKLAELYLSKIQSDILPSGEKVSAFRLGSKDLADLPYIRILTREEKRDLEKEKWELIRTRKSPARLREVLKLLRDGYKVVPR